MDEVLLLCLLAVLAGAETITDVARFGGRRLDPLRRFRPLQAGTLAHDYLGDILASLDADAFRRCFMTWVASLIGVAEGVVAIDGKTVRKSKGAKAATHVVSCIAPAYPRHLRLAGHRRIGRGKASPPVGVAFAAPPACRAPRHRGPVVRAPRKAGRPTSALQAQVAAQS